MNTENVAKKSELLANIEAEFVRLEANEKQRHNICKFYAGTTNIEGLPIFNLEMLREHLTRLVKGATTPF